MRKADEGKRTLGTCLLSKPSGPDGLRVRQPAELANPTERFEPVHEISDRSHGDPDGSRGKKKGLLKIYCLENLMISAQTTQEGEIHQYLHVTRIPGPWVVLEVQEIISGHTGSIFYRDYKELSYRNVIDGWLLSCRPALLRL